MILLVLTSVWFSVWFCGVVQLVNAPLSGGTSLLGDKDNAEIVRVVIGIDLAQKLSSDLWQDREAGLWGLAEAISTGKLPLVSSGARQPKKGPELWEVVLNIVKAGLLDASSHVNCAVYDVVVAITPHVDTLLLSASTKLSQPGSVVPWDSLDVQIPFGSLVKTLFGKVGDTRKRVSDVVRRIIIRLGQSNRTSFNAVMKPLLAPIGSTGSTQAMSTPITPISPSFSSTTGFPLSDSFGLKHFMQQTGKLRVLCDFLECPSVVNGVLTVPTEQSLTFVTGCLKSSCSTVAQLAKHCAEVILTSPDADDERNVTAVQAFLSSCDHSVRSYLEGVMDAQGGGGGGGGDGGGGVGVDLMLGVSGVGLNTGNSAGNVLSARSDAPSSARSVDSDGSWEGLGVNPQPQRHAPRSPSPMQSPNIMLPPGSPIATSQHQYLPSSSPLSGGLTSPVRRQAPSRNTGSAGPIHSGGGVDTQGTGVGIALSGGDGAPRRVPLAGRRALSAKVCAVTIELSSLCISL